MRISDFLSRQPRRQLSRSRQFKMQTADVLEVRAMLSGNSVSPEFTYVAATDSSAYIEGDENDDWSNTVVHMSMDGFPDEVFSLDSSNAAMSQWVSLQDPVPPNSTRDVSVRTVTTVYGATEEDKTEVVGDVTTVTATGVALLPLGISDLNTTVGYVSGEIEVDDVVGNVNIEVKIPSVNNGNWVHLGEVNDDIDGYFTFLLPDGQEGEECTIRTSHELMSVEVPGPSYDFAFESLLSGENDEPEEENSGEGEGEGEGGGEEGEGEATGEESASYSGDNDEEDSTSTDESDYEDAVDTMMASYGSAEDYSVSEENSEIDYAEFFAV